MKSPQDIIDHYKFDKKGGEGMKIGAIVNVAKSFEEYEYDKIGLRNLIEKDLVKQISDEIGKNKKIMESITTEPDANYKLETEHRLEIHVFTDAQLIEYVNKRVQDYVLGTD